MMEASVFHEIDWLTKRSSCTHGRILVTAIRFWASDSKPVIRWQHQILTDPIKHRAHSGSHKSANGSMAKSVVGKRSF
jgi:hypothetical protein